MIDGRSILKASSAIALVMLATPALAKATPAVTATEQEQERAPNDSDIVVTAQHRVQVLADVPQSISVVSGATLERQQAINFQDYAQLVPGLTLTQENPGETRLVLRGINTGSVGSTVAVYVDDVPFGSSGSLSNGGILAGDFDTFDVQRVEVLRGPQGTLYGSNSLGGVLKFVTGTPSTTKFEARGQAGVESTKSGDASYYGNALVNVPLSDTLALRGSGFYRKVGGYINTLGRTASDVNDSASFGGRASLLFKPSSDLSVRLTGLIQNINVDSPGTFEVNPITLQPVNAMTGAAQGTTRTRFELYPELNTVHYQLYNGTINYNFGFATLTSVTSYSTQKQKQISDISTNSARGTAQAVYGAAGATNTIGLAFQNDISVKKFTQEVRLASADSDVFEWLIGGYYTHEKTNLYQEYLPFTIATRTMIPPATTFSGLTFSKFVYSTIDAKYEEFAGFASGTLHLGPRFDITAGGRYSENNQDSAQAVVQLGGGSPTYGKSKEGVFTWSVAPRFEISDHSSVYARVAKGYRPGGPNFIPPGAPAGFPSQFQSDTLVSYEAGYRGETANHAFSIDLSAFYIDWKNILITTSTTVNGTPVGINGNGRRARSYGAEATVTLRPVTGFNVVGNITYTKAKLLDDTVPAVGGLNLTGGLAGDQLPYSPVWNANVSADYDWALSGNARAYVGGNIHMIADQAAGFSTAYRAAFGRRGIIDGYQTIDLRAGVNVDRFSIGIYVKNLTNEYALSNVTYPFTLPVALGGTNTPFARASSIRPQTIGATLGFNF